MTNTNSLFLPSFIGTREREEQAGAFLGEGVRGERRRPR